MPTFRYDDAEPRNYTDFGPVKTGSTVDADEPPDWRWSPVDEAPVPASVPAFQPPAEPEPPADPAPTAA